MLSTLQVGDFQWPLEKATPCLRSDDHTYTFAMSAGDTGPMFYCVILPKGEACLAVVANGSANAKAAIAPFSAPSPPAALLPDVQKQLRGSLICCSPCWPPPQPTAQALQQRLQQPSQSPRLQAACRV